MVDNIVEIRSRYQAQDLVTDARCDNCDSVLRILERDYSRTINSLTYTARNVPVLRCDSPSPECGGIWYPTEVSVDLSRRIARSLRRRGHHNLAANIVEGLRPLVASLRGSPTGLIKTP